MYSDSERFGNTGAGFDLSARDHNRAYEREYGHASPTRHRDPPRRQSSDRRETEGGRREYRFQSQIQNQDQNPKHESDHNRNYDYDYNYDKPASRHTHGRAPDSPSLQSRARPDGGYADSPDRRYRHRSRGLGSRDEENGDPTANAGAAGYRRRKGHRATDSTGAPLGSPALRGGRYGQDRDEGESGGAYDDEDRDREERRRRRQSRRGSRVPGDASEDDRDRDRERERLERQQDRLERRARRQSRAASRSRPDPFRASPELDFGAEESPAAGAGGGAGPRESGYRSRTHSRAQSQSRPRSHPQSRSGSVTPGQTSPTKIGSRPAEGQQQPSYPPQVYSYYSAGARPERRSWTADGDPGVAPGRERPGRSTRPSSYHPPPAAAPAQEHEYRHSHHYHSPNRAQPPPVYPHMSPSRSRPRGRAGRDGRGYGTASDSPDDDDDDDGTHPSPYRARPAAAQAQPPPPAAVRHSRRRSSVTVGPEEEARREWSAAERIALAQKQLEHDKRARKWGWLGTGGAVGAGIANLLGGGGGGGGADGGAGARDADGREKRRESRPPPPPGGRDPGSVPSSGRTSGAPGDSFDAGGIGPEKGNVVFPYRSDRAGGLAGGQTRAYGGGYGDRHRGYKHSDEYDYDDDDSVDAPWVTKAHRDRRGGGDRGGGGGGGGGGAGAGAKAGAMAAAIGAAAGAWLAEMAGNVLGGRDGGRGGGGGGGGGGRGGGGPGKGDRSGSRSRSRGQNIHHSHGHGHRIVSGNVLERGHSRREDRPALWKRLIGRGGGDGGKGRGGERRDGDRSEDEKRRKRKKQLIILGVVIALILLIAIPVAAVKAKNGNSGSGAGAAGNNDGRGRGSDSDRPNTNKLQSISKSSVPDGARGTAADPFTWLDTTDFNVTYTPATVGGLSLVGLDSGWDDGVQANEHVPPLNEKFEYGTMPIRGVNLGGWLNLEPFITPSLFDRFNRMENVVDEWTLSAQLGPGKAKATLENHYATFIRRADFEQIRAAGFDHVRIPFGYWAVRTYDGDPYVGQVAWRYLLRGIEWARQNGLRVKLDLHGAPGSQNGWNHSGRQGFPGWLNGTDGDLNGARTLDDIHDSLSKFFSQDRYRNVVTMYGLVNEPRMVVLDTAKVLSWTDRAIRLVRKNGFGGVIVFGDGFMGLDNWRGKLQDRDSYGALVLDVHQYVIFNSDQLRLPHDRKLNFACRGWTAQTRRSSDRATGFGPTMCGEWSQADTDCARHLNNVGVGARWDGTLNFDGRAHSGIASSELTPACPACSCDRANADPTEYSPAYRAWLRAFAEAQMASFEHGWGWFYWTWKTERAAQWSWQKGLEAGTVPPKVWERQYECGDDVPEGMFAGLEEDY